jgi:hypothetical protein
VAADIQSRERVRNHHEIKAELQLLLR